MGNHENMSWTAHKVFYVFCIYVCASKIKHILKKIKDFRTKFLSYWYNLHFFCGQQRRLMTSDPSTVQKLNEEYLEFNFSCSEVITQPLYCPKSDVEIGYVEVSFYRQQKHGFFREVIWDKVSKGQLISKCPFGIFKSPKKSTKFLLKFLS